MDKARKIIKETIENSPDLTYANVSRRLGKNSGYLSGYITKHEPAKLRLNLAVTLSEILKLQLEDLIDQDELLPAAQKLAEKRAKAIADDIAAFINIAAKKGSNDNIANQAPAHAEWYAIMKSNALEDLGILKGDTLYMKPAPENITDIENGAVVMVQLYDKKIMKARTVVRQFIAPNKLATNQPRNNEMINIDDKYLDYEPVIKAIIISSGRNF